MRLNKYIHVHPGFVNFIFGNVLCMTEEILRHGNDISIVRLSYQTALTDGRKKRPLWNAFISRWLPYLYLQVVTEAQDLFRPYTLPQLMY